ncbi:S4 domain-containing protein [Schleiferiaceae bacterium]|nr:S4 domain-containing protein [Schleiferiaceae bacterium]
MRIDKFLWCVRLFKTRTLAGEQVRSNRVFMDENSVKPSREVKEGDVFTLKRHGYNEVFQIKALPKSRVSAKFVADLIENKTPQVELDKMAFLRLARNVSRQKGLGRPTKKDRRDIDDLLDA